MGTGDRAAHPTTSGPGGASWLPRAACLGSRLDVFAPPDIRLSARMAATWFLPAMAICAQCPSDVRAACEADALDKGDIYLVRGGKTPDDLAEALRALGDPDAASGVA